MKFLRVLVVDDCAMSVKLVSIVLSNDSMVVDTAANATQAIKQISQAMPDLVLMDIRLPGMNGLELTRHLKAHATTERLKIVALTAYAMPSDEDRIRAAGCDGYITKPIDVATFAATVRAYAAEEAALQNEM